MKHENSAKYTHLIFRINNLGINIGHLLAARVTAVRCQHTVFDVVQAKPV